MGKIYFKPDFFRFLRDLKKNNNRLWFQANKERYERTVRNPLLDFIGEAGPFLRQISKNITADNSSMGGSMFRIYRDTRFSKDKTPYKTAAAAQFRHVRGKDVHAPGYYLHLEPGEVFCGAGIWHPEAPILNQIRDYLANHPQKWKAVLADKNFKKHCVLEGDKLVRPPKGFDPNHPLIEDLKRKDFTTFTSLDEKTACSPHFMEIFIESCRNSAPLMEFLAQSLLLPW
jgi:uncharacterized protein (TIGR02453 family)